MKRAAYILLIVLACILLTLGMLFAVVQSSQVQTAAVRVVTQELSRALGTQLQIGNVDYNFPNSLTATGIYIEDQQGDTLLYADTLHARFSLLGFTDQKILFREVALRHAYVNAYELPESGVTGESDKVRMNYDFLIDLIPASTNENKQMQEVVEVKNVTLSDLRLRYNDWHVNPLNASLDLHHFSKDSLHASVNSLSLTEQGGFALNDLQTEVFINKEQAQIRRLAIQLPNSELDLSGSICHSMDSIVHQHMDSAAENMFSHLFDLENLSSASVNLDIDKAELVGKDISRFVPELRNMRGKISFNGNVSGTLENLHAENLNLRYKDKNILEGDINFYGLPRLDTSYVHADLTDLALNKAIIQDFVSDIKGKPFVLPKNLAQLGDMHYRGIVDGRLDSLTLNGQFSSRLGNIQTDGQLLADSNYQNMQFRGLVQTRRFNVGRLAGSKQIGNIAFRMQADASVGEEEPLRAKLKGDINSIQLLGYNYRNIHVNGKYRTDEFDGEIRINDENLQLSVDGLLDMTQELPLVNAEARLSRLRLGPLNLSEKYADADISALVTVNASGNSLDNLDGYIYIDSLTMQRTDKRLFMRQLRVLAQTDDDEPTILKINSDFLNANLAGNYRYSTLPLTIRRLIAQHVPRALAENERQEAVKNSELNQMDFYAYFKNLDSITSVLDLPLEIPQMPTVKGFINEHTNQHALQVAVPRLKAGSQQFDDLTLNIDNRHQQLNLGLSAYKHASDNPAGDKMGDLDLLLHAVARNDSLYLDLGLQNTDSSRTEGILRTATHFTQYARKPLIDCHILPSEIMIADSVWTISDSHIVYTVADTTLQVNDFRFGGEYEYVYADGLASRRETDSINVELSNIVLDYILEYTNVKNSISFGGAITGHATAYSLFSQPMFEAEVWMQQAAINNAVLGDAHAKAMLNREEKTIDIWAGVTEQGDTVAKLDGVVRLAEKRWDLFIYPDSANLAFINHWTEGFIDNITGRGFGWVHVYGIGKDTWVEGRAFAKDATIGIPFLGTIYHLNDSVVLGLDNITFQNLTLYDELGNLLYLDGIVHHDKFKDFSYEINASVKNTLVMNLPENKKDMFYGRIFGTGEVNIKGNEKECRINANARTNKNSTFAFSTATATTAKENNFITFVDHRPIKQTNQAKPVVQTPKPTTKVYVDVQVEATPDLEVSIVIDPKTGDKLKGRGEGNLRFQYDVSADDVALYGTYTLNSGTFQFTLENLIRKEFTIRNGSTVTFSGDPLNLQIDASAVYSTTAALRDLFGSDYSNVATNRSSVPVNCIIYLRDNILNPLISFGIELPQSDESVSSQVKSIINTDEMMMREIIYLLVFNRFYTPEYLQTNTNVGLNETYSLLTNTVTSQINNWIRKLTNNFTVGFNIRAEGFDKESSQEYETQFQYTPNNRLILNGNLGYRYNDISNRPVFGNLDVEYLLDPAGRWRAKAYTHTVDKYSLREAHTIQGVGLMFKYDFNGADAKPKKTKKVGTSKETKEE
ncbi:MAG: translocation/assembly module TamB [Paludibacteraceae bacterium]|nr:translocation/assembly module TamB [Paludibacteraceae bacterium]